jgi:ketosteroid isomerase-like protein
MVALFADLQLPAEASALFEPDFESIFVAAAPAPTMRNRGFDGLVALWRDWLDAYDRYEVAIESVLDAGAQQVVLVRVHGRTARDGVELEHAPAVVWTFAGGRVTRLAFYLDRAEALAAAGLAA